MTAILITPPSVPLLTLDEAKSHLRVDHDDENSQIEAMAAAVASQLDPALGGWLGRALRPQTWRLDLDGFPCSEIVLPYPPLVSVTEFSYTDTDGATQTLAAGTGYRVVNAGELANAVLAPPYNGSWPSARTDYASVRITYTAGYAATPTDLLPAAIRAWSLLKLGTLYQHRETVTPSQVAMLPDTIDGLIWPFRVF